ncbi:Guanylate kinase [Planctomycetes bacterium Pan216]|uniref:Guanylate kinase n=1 Tax=Kolteria novifilia TaxID=2527975 RepID=A0A518BB91_9BACT|nr:Guanylate kinase [Planctomycetes bacterium Pan216]
MAKNSKRLIVLSGPSCAGKSPLLKAVGDLFPKLREQLVPCVFYNSRDARPGEEDGVDYHFRSREEIEHFRDKDDFVVMDVRGDLQAANIVEWRDEAEGDLFFEGNPFVGRALLEHPALENLEKVGMFLSPISKEEIRAIGVMENLELDDLVVTMMRRKLLRRTQRQKGLLGLPELEDIENRAGSAPRELRMACHFDHVIPNHDGEDSEHWWAFPLPLGDARRATLAVATLLRGEVPPIAEAWDEELFES